MAKHEAYIRGKRYTIQFLDSITSATGEELRGLCDPPAKPTHRKIQILRNQSIQNLMDTMIHEAIHAGLWDLDESAVESLATDIATMLIKAGFTIDESAKERLEG